MGYVANTRIKIGTWKTEDTEGEQYIEPGEPVSEGDFDEKDWNDLVAAKSVVDEEQYVLYHPELILGRNQASGTPSNLALVEGSKLQMNLPDPEAEEKAPELPAAVNPADPPHVEGAVNPGDGQDSHGQNVSDEDAPGVDAEQVKADEKVVKKAAASSDKDK